MTDTLSNVITFLKNKKYELEFYLNFHHFDDHDILSIFLVIFIILEFFYLLFSLIKLSNVSKLSNLSNFEYERNDVLRRSKRRKLN